MALFQKFERSERLFQVARQEPTTSQQDDSFQTLIVGLGNIGEGYSGTRHNIGFEVVEAYAKKHEFSKWQHKTKFKADICEDFVNGKKVILAKPTTFMNLSGEAVQALKAFYKLKNSEIIVVHDELDLEFGVIKEKMDGGSAGNNGLKSIISHIGADFRRLRIGIKNNQLTGIDAADFVLAKFTPAEKKQLPKLIKAATEKLL